MKTASAILKTMYWATNPEWYTRENGKDFFDGVHIKDDAPEEAKKSFEEWKKHKDE